MFWDETGQYNLVSSDQLNQSGFAVVLDNDDSALYQKEAYRMVGSNAPVTLPVAKIGALFLLPVHWPGAPPPAHPWQAVSDPTNDGHQLYSMLANGNLTLEELVHLRMAHTPIP